MFLDFIKKRGHEDNIVGARTSHVFVSFSIYSRQSMVVLASFLEGVISNFFFCVFCKYPNRMYNFIQSSTNQNTTGKVDLKKILSSSNLEDLVLQLASDASENAASGEYNSVLKRLVEVSNGILTLKKMNKTIEIIEIRNRIVHELNQDDIEPEFVAQGFRIVTEFINSLEAAAKEMEVPIFVFPDE